MDSNIMKILMRYYIDKEWICGETYASIVWYDDTLPKPTQEHLESLWEDLLLDEMREHRNRLLQESDYRALPDFPNTNKEAWLAYRRELRNLPSVWTEGTPFPEKPE